MSCKKSALLVCCGMAHRLPASGRMRPQKRVLIVDDNPVVQEVLKQFLARGYQVELAMNASQALAAVVQKSPDAILLDVRMPGVDGLGLLKSLRGMGVETPIFVMTGYDSTQVALEALESGATGYLPKPFDLLHLDKLIAHALGSQPAYA
jgi:CheY-like chemotaxis protein